MHVQPVNDISVNSIYQIVKHSDENVRTIYSIDDVYILLDA